jgi:hypothetical protein
MNFQPVNWDSRERLEALHFAIALSHLNHVSKRKRTREIPQKSQQVSHAPCEDHSVAPPASSCECAHCSMKQAQEKMLPSLHAIAFVKDLLVKYSSKADRVHYVAQLNRAPYAAVFEGAKCKEVISPDGVVGILEEILDNFIVQVPDQYAAIDLKCLGQWFSSRVSIAFSISSYIFAHFRLLADFLES